MAVHNFNYTYEYVGVRTMQLSSTDDTAIVKSINVRVTAVDQADNSQSLSEEQYVSLDGVFSYKHDGLPSGFILVKNLTEEKVLEWFKSKVDTADLDVYFTWQIYGAEEVSPIIDNDE